MRNPFYHPDSADDRPVDPASAADRPVAPIPGGERIVDQPPEEKHFVSSTAAERDLVDPPATADSGPDGPLADSASLGERGDDAGLDGPGSDERSSLGDRATTDEAGADRSLAAPRPGGAVGSAAAGQPAAAGGVQGMVPARARRRSKLERILMRLVATLGVVAIGTAIGAIMVGQDVQGWIVGLVVSVVSVALAAVLWSSRQL